MRPILAEISGVRNSITLDVENAILMLKSCLTWGCFQKGRAESSQSLHARKVKPAWSETSRESDGPGEAFFASLGVADFRVSF
ncbi:hypothetical protein [Chryseomicrobium excrementi]|nr:hypothetical protein [Chryseomicrobium excrementi]